jgi:uracil-DNA glycosylase
VHDLPDDWRRRLALDRAELAELARFVEAERACARVFPPEERVFAALASTPFEAVRVVVLGQDPYHGEGQAHGLAFSVARDVRKPPSLANLLKELEADLGVPAPAHGSLEAWAARGVLLLNTVLTVREAEAGSHAGRGWERVTDAVIDALVARPRPVVFALFGAHAQKKAKRIAPPHRLVLGVHPSPLSAHRGFFGSRPFSAIDAALAEIGEPKMDWSLDD